MTAMLWLPPLALALDLLIPDPQRLPHPVCGIGFLANKLEGPARRLARGMAEGMAEGMAGGMAEGMAKDRRGAALPRMMTNPLYMGFVKARPLRRLTAAMNAAYAFVASCCQKRFCQQPRRGAAPPDLPGRGQRPPAPANGGACTQQNDTALIFTGGLALGGICLVSAATAALLCALPSFWGTLCALYLAWAGLALGGLIREGKKALALIAAAQDAPDKLPEARHAVAMLVSRDVHGMDVPDLYRSLAESLSENLNDAFVAPFFWLCAGGPIALWLYKSVSTMDSMWGYTNERFLYLGRASARLDDVLAYLPARLCVCIMLLAVWIEKRLRSLRALVQCAQRQKTLNPRLHGHDARERHKYDSQGLQENNLGELHEHGTQKLHDYDARKLCGYDAQGLHDYDARQNEYFVTHDASTATVIPAQAGIQSLSKIATECYQPKKDTASLTPPHKNKRPSAFCMTKSMTEGAMIWLKKIFSLQNWPGWRIVAVQAKQSASPNAGWPMATAAWLLGGRCGGPTPYEGRMVDKPIMGPQSGAWNLANTQELISLLRMCGMISCGISLLFVFL